MSDNTRGEFATGIACLIIGTGGLLQIASRPSTPVMGGDLGPTFVPSLLLYMLLVLGGILVAMAGYRLWSKPSPEPIPTTAAPAFSEEIEPEQHVLPYARYLPVAILVMMCACVIALPRLGFDLSVAGFFFAVGLLLHRIKMGAFTLRGIALCVVEAVVLTAALSFMLRYVLRVPLP